jgi:YHS domain-containing protein
MAEIDDLVKRIDAAFNASQEKLKASQAEKLQHHVDRQQRLEQFAALCEDLAGVWRPRLEALKTKFGDHVHVEPKIEPNRRSAHFRFDTEVARVDLQFAACADTDARNVVISYDLDILPILMKIDSHAELQFPLDAVDREALARWIDDRIVGFVQTYLSLHENAHYLKGHMVEDPVAKVQFPKFAAGATLVRDGKTYYFIDESTRDEFEKQHVATPQPAMS